MNILPLVLALVLMVSVLTVERLEKFKNHSIVQKEYQVFLKESERQVFNRREKRLFKDYEKSLRQLTFRYFYDKEARDGHLNEAKQYRMLAIELMRTVYGEAAFFKELERKRPDFLEEILKAIENATEEAPEKLIIETKDLARLNLEDPELQDAFYHMLKGTILRDKLMNLKEKGELTPKMKEKAYVSLFTFIHNEGAKSPPTIKIGSAPPEILKAVFGNDEIVEAILLKRKELGGKDKDSGAEEAFQSEFIGKRRPGIDEHLLDFKLSANSTKYD